MFNNSEDSVRLLDPNNVLVDSFEYSKAVKGISFGRINESDEFCLQKPSKSAPNNSCLNPENKQTVKQPAESKPIAPTPLRSFRNVSLKTPQTMETTSVSNFDFTDSTVSEVLGEANLDSLNLKRIRALSFFSITVSVYSFVSVLLRCVIALTHRE